VSIRDCRALPAAELDFREALEGVDPAHPSTLDLLLVVTGLDAALAERCLSRLDDHARQRRARVRLELCTELDGEPFELPDLPDLEPSR